MAAIQAYQKIPTCSTSQRTAPLHTQISTCRIPTAQEGLGHHTSTARLNLVAQPVRKIAARRGRRSVQIPSASSVICRIKCSTLLSGVASSSIQYFPCGIQAHIPRWTRMNKNKPVVLPTACNPWLQSIEIWVGACSGSTSNPDSKITCD